MEAYKNNLRKRRNTLILSAALSLIVLSIFGFIAFSRSITIYSDNHLGSYMLGASTGLLVGVLLVMVMEAVKCQRALKNPDYLQTLYVKESDERSCFINNRSASIGFNFTLVALAVSIAISSWFHTIVSLTLLAAMVFMVILRLCLKLYYQKKY